MELMEAAAAEFERVVRGLPADCWEAGTPSDMSVRDLVEHVVVGNRFTAMLLSGVAREDAWAAVSGDQLRDDPVAAVRESAERQTRAFATASDDQPVPFPTGPVPASMFRRFRLVDLVVHGWDLLRATGQDETLDPAVVSGLWDVVEPHLEAMLAFGAYGDGPSGRLSAETDLQTRLLDTFGRRP